MTLGIISIIIVITITLAVSFGTIKEKHYPHCIALMSAGLIYAITLLGPYVVGSDIQGELAASRSALANGWDFRTATDVNAITGINITSIVTSVLAPTLSRLLHLDLVWIYKTVMPLFLIAVPVVMYYAFKKQMGSKKAFYAALFFIIMPVFSLQLAQIVKSMVAELFFALAILVMVSSWKTRYKIPAIIACSLLTMSAHYTMGIALLAYLLGIFLIRLVTARLNRWKLWSVRKVPVAALLLVLLMGTGAFYTYYHYAYGGTVNQVLYGAIKWHGNSAILYTEGAIEALVVPPESVPPETTTTPPEITTTTPIVTDPITTPAAPPEKSYLYNQEYTVQVGIGLDFATQPIEGKIFRVLQYLTQILIVIGTFWLLFRHKNYKFTAEFVAGVLCSFVLLATCVFVPQFSALINMPRFYQISLFFLSPMLVLGCDAISSIRLPKLKGAR